jgi:hypothetical protein
MRYVEALEFELKMIRGGSSSKLRTAFGKTRRAMTPGPGRAGGAVYGMQGRLKRAEDYLGKRSKREAPYKKSQAKRAAKDQARRMREEADTIASITAKLRSGANAA